jgi:hypothetical protein
MHTTYLISHIISCIQVMISYGFSIGWQEERQQYSHGNNSPLMATIQHYSSDVNVSSDKLDGCGFVKKYFVKKDSITALTLRIPARLFASEVFMCQNHILSNMWNRWEWVIHPWNFNIPAFNLMFQAENVSWKSSSVKVELFRSLCQTSPWFKPTPFRCAQRP